MRKIGESFGNTNHENKLSKVVKRIKKQLMDTFKGGLKNDKVFLWNDVAQIKDEICNSVN